MKSDQHSIEIYGKDIKEIAIIHSTASVENHKTSTNVKHIRSENRLVANVNS